MVNRHNKSGMKNRRFFFFLMIPVLFCILAGVVMLLWNAILPDVLQVRALTYWQAFGLLILSRILLGGFRFGGKKGGTPYGGPPRHIRERWMRMSEEEKSKFKEAWRKRCEEKKS